MMVELVHHLQEAVEVEQVKLAEMLLVLKEVMVEMVFPIV